MFQRTEINACNKVYWEPAVTLVVTEPRTNTLGYATILPTQLSPESSHPVGRPH
jgi:hypothetical protein